MHEAEARKLDRLVFGEASASASAQGNAMHRGQNGDKNDEGASGENR
jgi:hypothetical protein